MVAGELTFAFMLVDKLLSDGIKVVCSCSRRMTVEVKKDDGTNEKQSVFLFEGFREYTRYGKESAMEKELMDKEVLCIFSDVECFALVSDLHQTHAPNDNQCCQRNKRINCDAVEHGLQSGFLEVEQAGIQANGSQRSDHQEFAGGF